MVEEAAALASRLKHRLIKKNWTISTAESCTGGMISSLLTDISGASAWFKQGWIVYSNESKMRELGVESPPLMRGVRGQSRTRLQFKWLGGLVTSPVQTSLLP